METIYKSIELEHGIYDVGIDVEVDSYVHVLPWTGNKHDCPSELDYHGYTSLSYTVVSTYIIEESGNIPYDIPIDNELEHEIYSELLVRAASYREEDLDDEPLCYIKY